MKLWTIMKIINAPIENVWKVLDGDLKNLEHLDCRIISSKEVLLTEDNIGSKYLQTYMVNGKEMEHEVVVSDYLNELDEKVLELSFIHKNKFNVTIKYNLKKVTDFETQITYKVINNSTLKKDKLFKLLAYNCDDEIREYIRKIEALANKA